MDTLRPVVSVPSDCVGQDSMSADIAVLMTLRVLRTGSSCQQFDDQCGFSKSTVNSRFKLVIRAINSQLGPQYLPEVPDQSIEAEAMEAMADRGFIGCAGSFDCSHVTWKCPKRLQPMYKGKEADTTIVMQCIATPSLYCTHCFVGSSGANNDLTTLRLDRFIHKILSGTVGLLDFVIGGETFKRRYYLADGIYPTWSIFAIPLPTPLSLGEKRYTRRQESSRKDVERLFGVIKQRFKIIRSGNRVEYRDKEFLCQIVRACFILHNMIVTESQGNPQRVPGVEDSTQPTADADSSADADLVLEFGTVDPDCDLGDKSHVIAQMVTNSMAVIDADEHFRLRAALIRHHANVTIT